MRTDRALFLSRFLGTLAFQTLSFYGFFEIFHRTQSPLHVGLAGLALYLPTLVLSLGAGIYADRIKRIGLAYLAIQLAPLFGIAALLGAGHHEALILISLAYFSLVRALRSPVYYSLVGASRDSSFCQQSATRVARLNTLAWQLPLVLAPIVVGILPDLSGVESSPLVGAALFQLVAFVMALSTRKLRRAPPSQMTPSIQNKPGVFGYLQALSARKDLLRPIYADAALASCLGMSALIPFFLASKDLDITLFASLKSLFHGSSLLVVLIVPAQLFGNNARRNFARLLGAWGFCALALCGVSSAAGLAAGLACFGAIDGLSCLYREQLIFKHVPRAELGRVSAINSFFVSTGDEFGEFNTGALIGGIGVVSTLALNSLVAFGLCWSLRENAAQRLDTKTFPVA